MKQIFALVGIEFLIFTSAYLFDLFLKLLKEHLDVFYKKRIDIMKNLRIAFFLFVFVVIPFIVIPCIYHFEIKFITDFLGKKQDLEGLFAPAAAFFSGIVFYFMYTTYKSQEEQLLIMKKESKEKSFETVFFNLLQIHRENYNLVNNITDEEFKKEGFYFRKTYEEMETAFHLQQYCLEMSRPPDHIHKSLTPEKNKKLFKTLKIIERYSSNNKNNKQFIFYQYVYESQKSIFTSYFRHYFHLLKYLHNEFKRGDLSPDTIFKYRDILKAQLSPYEHALLYYNGLFFKEVIKKSGYYRMITDLKMLDDIDKELLFDEGAIGHYPKEAFGEDLAPKWGCYNV